MRQGILVTGGAGYVGGRIAKVLLDSGKYNVRISTRSAPKDLPLWTRQFDVVRADVSSMEEMRSACDSIDSVIHLAAMGDIECAASPENALIVNTLGTLHTLKAAQSAAVKRFLYFSTAHVYASPLAGIITEKTPTRPIHPYSITHRAAEDFVAAAHQRNLMTGIVIRLSNGYGSPLDNRTSGWKLLTNDLCRQAALHGKLQLRSSGMQRRDFVTLCDVARAVEHLLSLHSKKIADGIFNLGGENSMRVIDMAEVIAERCEATLGIRPQIIRPRPNVRENSSDLKYCIAKLKATGFRLHNDMIAEIDATLRASRVVCTAVPQ